MLEITAAADIDAPPEAVWEVLTDLQNFHNWNPFIRKAFGSTELGGTVHVRVKPSLPIRLGFHAKVTELVEGKHLRWYGRVLAGWLARGDHTFDVEPLADNKARFVQRERFGGILPRLAKRLLAREAQRGFEAMNRALDECVRGER